MSNFNIIFISIIIDNVNNFNQSDSEEEYKNNNMLDDEESVSTKVKLDLNFLAFHNE